MAARINPLIMQNRLLSQAKSGLRTKNTQTGKVLNKQGSSRSDHVKDQADQKNSLSKRNAASKENYMTMKEAGSSLTDRAKQLLSLPGKEMEELSQEGIAEYREKVLTQTEGLIKDYNALVRSMEEEGGTVNQLYLKRMQEYLKDAGEDLKRIGITGDKSGMLSLDKETLKTADVQELKRILGTEGSFTDKAGKRAENILANAETNLAYLNKSIYAGNYSYNRYGSDIFDSINGYGKYNARG